VQVRVQYTAQLRTVVGQAEDQIELADESTVKNLLVQIAEQVHPEAAPYLLAPAGEPQPSLLVAINGAAVTSREASAVRLREGDVVMLMPPIAGG
jgi:molybdopterin synthase sulfur carrier subunit